VLHQRPEPLDLPRVVAVVGHGHDRHAGSGLIDPEPDRVRWSWPVPADQAPQPRLGGGAGLYFLPGRVLLGVVDDDDLAR
jgi:hypothetical protein